MNGSAIATAKLPVGETSLRLSVRDREEFGSGMEQPRDIGKSASFRSRITLCKQPILKVWGNGQCLKDQEMRA